MKQLVRLIFIIALALLEGCQPFEKKPVAEKGVINLNDWNFDNKIDLDGEWEFYWKQLYTPADFRKDSLPLKTGYLFVPSNWNSQLVGNTTLSGQGYATYRLLIKGSPGQLMGMHIPDAYSTHRLWINGVLVASNGHTDTSVAGEVPELRPMIRMFDSRDENELVLQVSNYFQDKGGANSSMTMGTMEQISRSRDVSIIFTMFIVGMLLILFVYHVVIFLLSRTDYIAFWFAFLCLSIAMRCLVTNDKLILVIFPNFSPDLASRIEYLSAFGGAVLFGAFIHSLFPKEFPKTMLYILFAGGIAELVIIGFLRTKVYTSMLSYYQVLALLQILYFLWVLIMAVRNRRQLALNIIWVVIVTFIVTVNDILYARLIVNTAFIISYAVPFLLVAQAYLIAYRIGHALKSVQKLSVELNDANVHLEQKVKERTLELETEKKKTDDLLLNILPAETAEELKEKGHSIARTYSMVSVMFIDVTGFAHVDEHTGAALAVGEINYCFSAFDNIIQEHGIEKIKTIGNVYLCASGLPVPSLNHAEHIIKAAQEINAFIERRRNEHRNDAFSFSTRIGISIGPVVAGIVGTRKFAYDIWGDTVNTAARMQQHGEPGKINISGRTYELVKNKFNCIYRGKIEAKNKGMIDMYYVG